MVTAVTGGAELLLDLPGAQVWRGDSRRLDFVPDGSVHLCVTSPPYWNRVDYGQDEGQLGSIDDYERFRAELERVWREVARVLVPGGVVAVNMPNLYPRVKPTWGTPETDQRQMIPAPMHVAEWFLGTGFTLQEWIIWAKFGSLRRDASGMKRRVFGSYPLPGFIYSADSYEPIVTLRAPGKREFDRDARQSSRLTVEDLRQINNSIWTVRGEDDRNHPAIFPEEIPARLIKMYTCQGETVLDPFLGSGTSVIAATKLGRRGLGVEVSVGYAAEAARRCSQLVMTMD